MWRVVHTYEDGEKHKAEVVYNLDSSVTHAQATAFASALGSTIAPFPVLGRIVKAELQQDLGVPSGQNNAVPHPDSEVELKAAFGFRTAAGKPYRISIPTIDKAEAILPSNDLVDMGYAEIADFRDIMLNGVDVSGTIVRAVDTNGSALSELESAVEAYGKKRKSRGARLHNPG